MRFEAVDIVVHRTEDPEVIVGEFAYLGITTEPEAAGGAS